MGETSTSQAQVDEVDERAPLLGLSEDEPNEPEAPAKRAGKWVARNAVLIFVSLLVLAVVIILCIFFASRLPHIAPILISQLRIEGQSLTRSIGYRTKKPVPKASLCLTPACVHASSEILYNLSPEYKNLDPCDDFEELVCGGWDERHDLRPDQGDAFTGTIMSENSQMLLRHILEAPYPEDSDVSV